MTGGRRGFGGEEAAGLGKRWKKSHVGGMGGQGQARSVITSVGMFLD